MEIAGYRLRDRGAGCTGPVTVHRAEVVDRPGQLVRLTCMAGAGGSRRLAADIAAWQAVHHPALLTVEAVERSGDTLLLRSPGATARPLDTLDTVTVPLPPAAVARIGERIAEGLAALHLDGQTHGAVGAHTILLGSEGAAVLDGPWHAACLADDLAAAGLAVPAPRPEPAHHDEPDRRGAPTPGGSLDPHDEPDDAARDVRALATTLLVLLTPTDQSAALGPRGTGSRTVATEPRRRTARPTDTPADADALGALLQSPERGPVTARELQQALRSWRTQAAPAAPAPRPTPTAPDEERAARSFPGSLAVIAVAALLGVLGVLGVARPTPAPIPDLGASAPPATPTTTTAPTRSTTSTSAPGATEPAPATAAAIGAADATVTDGPATLASDPSVCPASPPPPGRGLLVLADLDGRGCRTPVRVHGNRLSARTVNGTVAEVELDLEPGDQVRVADLDGAGRDEVIVYRPGTGEVFRFAGLAGPEEAITARGQPSGRTGGTAVVVRDPSGSDRLELRGGAPA